MSSRCVLLLSLILGVAASTAIGQDRVKIAAAHWVYITEAVIATQDEPDGPVVPVDDKCENCNGLGKVGDGTIMRVCPVCDGTGKRVTSTVHFSADWPPRASLSIDSAGDATPKTSTLSRLIKSDVGPHESYFTNHPWLRVYVPRFDCEHCDRWKTTELSAVLGKSWMVTRVEMDRTSAEVPIFPFFELRNRGRGPVRIGGFQTAQQLFDMLPD